MFDGKDMLKIGDKERRGILGKNLHDFPGPHDLLKSFHEGGDRIVEMIRLLKYPAKRKRLREEACGLLEIVESEEGPIVIPIKFPAAWKQRVVIAITVACRP